MKYFKKVDPASPITEHSYSKVDTATGMIVQAFAFSPNAVTGGVWPEVLPTDIPASENFYLINVEIEPSEYLEAVEKLKESFHQVSSKLG